MAGTPLIGDTLRRFVALGVQRVAIILNESESDCADWMRRHFSFPELDILVKTTRSSFESFWRVGLDLHSRFHLSLTDYGWPARVICCIYVLMFFGSAISKIRTSGVDWGLHAPGLTIWGCHPEELRKIFVERFRRFTPRMTSSAEIGNGGW